MRRIGDMIEANRSRSKDVLEKIGREDPDAIKQAYEELLTIDPEGSTLFSVDGKDEIIPFQDLREYLRANNKSLRQDAAREADMLRKQKMQDSEVFSYDDDSMQEDVEDGYYWDDPNRGYEHMNPEAVKDRVLSTNRRR